jgi:hypothetical protein
MEAVQFIIISVNCHGEVLTSVSNRALAVSACNTTYTTHYVLPSDKLPQSQGDLASGTELVSTASY